MSTSRPEPDLASVARRLDELIRAFEDHPDPKVRSRAQELLECVDSLHRAGVWRLATLLQPAGLMRGATDDPAVRLLFELYDVIDEPSEEQGSPPGLIPLTVLPSDSARTPAWRFVGQVSSLPPDSVHCEDIEDARVLFLSPGGEVHAFLNVCPGTPLPLDGAALVDGALRCPWHGCLFDARTGSRKGSEQVGLTQLPTRVVDGRLEVAVPVGVSA